MTVTYDIGTDVGKVRLKIGDTDTDNAILSDEEIEYFLDVRDGNINLASADALEAIAASDSFLAKVQRIGSYTEDLKSLADSIRKTAMLLRDQEEETPVVGFAEIAQTDFTARQIVINEALRNL